MDGDGPEAFISFIESYVAANPELHIDIKRIIAEGDFVVTHSQLKLNPADRGMEADAPVYGVCGPGMRGMHAYQVLPGRMPL